MFMKQVIRYTVLLVLIVLTSDLNAQEKVETTISSDLVSQYIWRGQDLGNVSIQPTLGIRWKGLELTGWGSLGLSEPNDTKEIDLTLSYSCGGFEMAIIDYWTNDGLDPKMRYFKYGAHSTNHVFEANIGYDFHCASVMWSTVFSGNDGFDNKGNRAYSSYFEINFPFKFAAVDWDLNAGAVPYATTFYDVDKFSITNLSLKASKEVKVTDSFCIPMFAQFVINPHSQKSYLVFGITLQP